MKNNNSKKLILVELNEINFDIVQKYISKKKLNFFPSIVNKETKITKSENEYSKLEPWIQWVSAHTGMTADEHKIFRLGESKNFNIEQIFEKIEKKNFTIGVLFSMNVLNKLKNPKYFIPDPWTETKASNSFWCKIINKAIKQAVNDNSANKVGITSYLILLLTSIRFIRFTKYKFFLDLFLKSYKKKWYKSLLLDFLISEIHLNFLKNKKTNFSTVFYNAGAHIQHHYFHNSKEIKNKIKNPHWYINQKYDPIKDMLKMYDEILKSYLSLTNKGYNLIFVTGLSQKPYNKVKFYYRLKNHESFLKKLDIRYESVQKLMTRDFFIFFKNNRDRNDARIKLKKIFSMNKKVRIFDEIEIRNKSLFVTLTYPNEINKNFKILYEDKKIDFFDEVNFVAIKNGMHSSKGYSSFHGDIKKFAPKNGAHVKKIFNSIDSFFS